MRYIIFEKVVFIMTNFKQFLNKTSNITNGERLVAMACTVLLTGIGMYLNNKLFDTRIELLNKKIELENQQRLNDVYKKIVDNHVE